MVEAGSKQIRLSKWSSDDIVKVVSRQLRMVSETLHTLISALTNNPLIRGFLKCAISEVTKRLLKNSFILSAESKALNLNERIPT